MKQSLDLTYINLESESINILNSFFDTFNFEYSFNSQEKILKKLAPSNLVFINTNRIDFQVLELDIDNPVVLIVGKDTCIEKIEPLLSLHIVDTFVGLPDTERFKIFVTKMSKNLLHENIPYGAMEHILKSSIKVKTLEELKEYLSDYLAYFKDTKLSSFFSNSEGKYDYLYGEKDLKVEEQIDSISLQDRYIGSSFERGKKILVPVNNEEDNVIWITLETKSKDKRFLNDLFFIHLNRINLYKKLKRTVGELTHISMSDEVTNLYNQRKLAVDLEIEVKTCQEKGCHFSLLFIDIDHFKKVNDSFGHVIGSKLLKDLGDVLVDQVRATDTVYRYGGDEFIVLMRRTKTSTVHDVAKRMLGKVKNTDFIIKDNEVYKLSVSIGIAEFPKDASSPKEIIEFADKMMYKSKDNGRGKVFHVKEIEE